MTDALWPLVDPINGQSFTQWLIANPQPNWQNWQAWHFPQDMAEVYSIQRSKCCPATDLAQLLITLRARVQGSVPISPSPRG